MVQSSNGASEEGITNLVIWSLSQLDLKHDALIIIIKYGTRLPGSWDARRTRVGGHRVNNLTLVLFG